MVLKKKLCFILSSAMLFSFLFLTSVSAQCVDCDEVQKGKISPKYLDKTVKKLPSGIQIWDNKEAFDALTSDKGVYLWVDTRPASFHSLGTIKGSVLLYYDQKGVPIPEAEKIHEMTEQTLKENMKKVNADISKVTVVFFCQGPECHRSYNASLRSVRDYGLKPANVIWFRDGYPNFFQFLSADSKLNKRIGKYLVGTEISE